MFYEISIEYIKYETGTRNKGSFMVYDFANAKGLAKKLALCEDTTHVDILCGTTGEVLLSYADGVLVYEA